MLMLVESRSFRDCYVGPDDPQPSGIRSTWEDRCRAVSDCRCCRSRPLRSSALYVPPALCCGSVFFGWALCNIGSDRVLARVTSPNAYTVSDTLASCSSCDLDRSAETTLIIPFAARWLGGICKWRLREASKIDVIASRCWPCMRGDPPHLSFRG